MFTFHVELGSWGIFCVCVGWVLSGAVREFADALGRYIVTRLPPVPAPEFALHPDAVRPSRRRSWSPA